MEQIQYVIVNNCGRFDLQSALGKMPGFIWRKYFGEKHMIYKLNKLNKFPFSGYFYFGPSSAINIRLDENDQPNPGDKPVSPTDEFALHHDIAYRDADKLDPETALPMKQEADIKMIEQ